MKITKKYARIGAEVRSSKEYIRQLARLVYHGYDVYEQITYDAEGNGVVRFAAIPQSLPAEAPTRFTELHFKYSYSFWRIFIEFEGNEERESREIGLIIQGRKKMRENEGTSNTDPEQSSGESPDFQLQ